MHLDIKNLELELSVMRGERDRARSTYRRIAADCAELEYRIRDLRTQQQIEGEPDPKPSIRLVPQLGVESPPTKTTNAALPMDVDLEGAVDHAERFKRLCEHTGQREWHIDTVCQWIIDMGASSAAPTSIRSRIYGMLKASPSFAKIRPRVFRYQGDMQDSACGTAATPLTMAHDE